MCRERKKWSNCALVQECLEVRTMESFLIFIWLPVSLREILFSIIYWQIPGYRDYEHNSKLESDIQIVSPKDNFHTDLLLIRLISSSGRVSRPSHRHKKLNRLENWYAKFVVVEYQPTYFHQNPMQEFVENFVKPILRSDSPPSRSHMVSWYISTYIVNCCSSNFV